MIGLSEEKLTHLSHLILNSLKQPGRVRFKVEEPLILREIKRLLAAELTVEREVDAVVRRRLASYARPAVEGSSEWDILYRKAFEDEMRKRGKF